MFAGHYHHGGSYGWGGGYGRGYYSNALPAVYAVAGDCTCKGAGQNGSGALGGLETLVKNNPMAALIGAFALGYLLMGKKSR